MKPCRVCGQPVTPWRRDWRRPTTTIHAACLLQRCRFCRQLFVVGKERKGLFCSAQHQWRFQTDAADARAHQEASC